MTIQSMLMRTLVGGHLPATMLFDLTLTVVRIFTGLAMALAHGWGKVIHVERIPERALNVGFPELLAMPMGWAAALSEFAGGLLLAMGLLTRPAAFFILCTMTVATYSHIVVRGDPFTGYEKALLFWFLAFQFVLVGSGRFSMDYLLRR